MSHVTIVWLCSRAYAAVRVSNELAARVRPADAHANPESAILAKRNGVGAATGNLAMRHLGIPTVTVPMGVAEDIHMPFGITFAGAAYSDQKLVGLASVYEALTNRRVPPPRTP